MTIKDRLDWKLGDDEGYDLAIYSDSAGTVPLDITGRTYVMSVASTAGATVLLSDAGTVTGASGLVSFDFAAAAIDAALDAGTYVFDVVETASSLESTLVQGPLSVSARVTAP